MRYLAVLLLALSACSTEAVTLRARDGRAVTCGPYSTITADQSYIAATRESQCIADYQRQGFERAPH